MRRRKDTNVYALIVPAAPTQKPAVTVEHMGMNGNYISFLSQRTFPEGTYTFVEFGVIYTKNDVPADLTAASTDMTLDKLSPTVKATSTKNRSLNGQFMMNITSASSGNVYVRAYLVYKDSSGERHTKYSPIAQGMLTLTP